MDVRLERMRMEEVNNFKYLGVQVLANGRIDADLEHRMGEARKMAGVLKGAWRQRMM
jgi:hypothetical protein